MAVSKSNKTAGTKKTRSRKSKARARVSASPSPSSSSSSSSSASESSDEEVSRAQPKATIQERSKTKETGSKRTLAGASKTDSPKAPAEDHITSKKSRKKQKQESSTPETTTALESQETSSQPVVVTTAPQSQPGTDGHPQEKQPRTEWQQQYLRAVTAQFADDLSALRQAPDFSDGSVAVLVRALQQGSDMIVEGG